jgi:hypothetical protein
MFQKYATFCYFFCRKFDATLSEPLTAKLKKKYEILHAHMCMCIDYTNIYKFSLNILKHLN